MKHGGDLSEAIARYGGTLQDWLDLSTGINPNAWPADALLSQASLHRLPAQGDLEKLLTAARDFFKAPDNVAIVAAPGAQSLIQWLPYLAPDGSVAILAPTYSEYENVWAGAERAAEPIRDPADLRAEHRHFICVNPNNPDGKLLSLDTLQGLAKIIKARDGWLIIDESFIETMPEKSSIGFCAEFPVLVLRSFGKFFGLPGLRLGFLIAQEKIAARFRQVLGPWPVTSDALIIGTAAYTDHIWAVQARTSLAAMAEKLDSLLTETGFTLIGGTNLFRLATTPDAKALHEHLAKRHIWCRCFEDNETHLRFGVPGNEKDLARLKEALRHKDFHA